MNNPFDLLSEKLDIILAEVSAVKSELKNSTPLKDSEFLNSNDAADFLCITPTTLNKYSSAGKIPFYKPSGEKYRIYKKIELIEWIEKGRKSTLSETYNSPKKDFWLQSKSLKSIPNKKPASDVYMHYLRITKNGKDMSRWDDPVPSRY